MARTQSLSLERLLTWQPEKSASRLLLKNFTCLISHRKKRTYTKLATIWITMGTEASLSTSLLAFLARISVIRMIRTTLIACFITKSGQLGWSRRRNFLRWKVFSVLSSNNALKNITCQQKKTSACLTTRTVVPAP